MLPRDLQYDTIDTQSITVQDIHGMSVQSAYHYHPFFEISLVNGKGKRIVGNRIDSFKGIDFVLLGQHLPHTWFDYQSIDMISLHFTTASIEHSKHSLPELKAVKNLLKQAEKGLSFQGIADASGGIGLKVYTRELRRLQSVDGLDRLIALVQLLQLMTQDNSRMQISEYEYSYPLSERWELRNRVLRYLLEHFTLDLDIKQVANQANLSVSAFCHFFKKTTNYRFSDYLNKLKVGYASKLLVETNQQVSKIAYQTGYNSLSNFNKRFKEVQGIAPSQYRSGLQA